MRFIQPVSMPCTKEQFEKYLEKRLADAGYEVKYAHYGAEKSIYIGTNFTQMPTRVAFISESYINSNSRYYIPNFNAELFLAIVAMTDEKYGIPGEYWTYRGTSNQDWTHGVVYKSVKPANELSFISTNSHGGFNGFYVRGENLTNFRKSTLEELVEQLTKQKDMETRKEVERTFRTTRQDLTRLWKVACSDWKITIKGYAEKYGDPLSDEIFIPEDRVEEMFKAATPEQESILAEIFPDFLRDTNAWKKVTDITELDKYVEACKTLSQATGSILNIQLLKSGTAGGIGKLELADRALWVSRSLEVILHKKGEDTIIEFRRR